jgi:quercetin dioxygenase-like cupin family protein
MSKAKYYKWADLAQTPMTPQIKRRLVSGEKLMVVKLTLDKGAVVSSHHHPHEQMTIVLSGSLEFDVDGEKQVVNSDEVICLPSNVPHEVIALEDTVTLDLFSPPREDFLTGEPPAYMQE